MNSEREQHRVWFETVVQPKLNILNDLSKGAIDLHTFDFKAFFNEFLADLELLTLDNLVTEIRIEKICTAIELIKKSQLNSNQDFPLQDLALIAFLNNPVDRLLFFRKWQKYMQFVKTHSPIDDEDLVNAYRLSTLIKNLAEDIQRSALTVIAETSDKAS